MELVLVMLGMAALAIAAFFGGSDSRPGLDDEPRRAI